MFKMFVFVELKRDVILVSMLVLFFIFILICEFGLLVLVS